MSDRAGLVSNGDDTSRSNAGVILAGKIRQPAFWQTLAPFLTFVAMLLAVSVLKPAYISGFGISIVTASAAPIMLLALGQSMVLNIGSIDLSNAAIGLLGAIVLALVLPVWGVGAFFAILALVTVFGAVNGAIVAYGQVPSFAITLGTLGVFEAAALVVSGSKSIFVTQNSGLVTVLYQYQLVNIPLTFWIGVFVAVLYWLLLRFTGLGQGMTAIGKSESGAIFSAVRVRWLKVVAFAISGFTAGLASISIVAQGGSAAPNGLGSNLLLPGIAAALIGGTSITGGRTNPINVVFGALTVAFVPSVIQAGGFNSQTQVLVYGFFIIIVVALSTSRSHDVIIK